MMIDFKLLSARKELFARITGVKLAEFLKIAEKVQPLRNEMQAAKKCHGRNFNLETLKSSLIAKRSKENVKIDEMFPSDEQVRSSKPQIINSGDDIEPQMKFFLKISVNGAQDFEFFELSKGMLNDNPF